MPDQLTVRFTRSHDPLPVGPQYEAMLSHAGQVVVAILSLTALERWGYRLAGDAHGPYPKTQRGFNDLHVCAAAAAQAAIYHLGIGEDIAATAVVEFEGVECHPETEPAHQTDPAYALCHVLTDDEVFGLSPAYQVAPIMRLLDAMGWMLTRKNPAIARIVRANGEWVRGIEPNPGPLHPWRPSGPSPGGCGVCGQRVETDDYDVCLVCHGMARRVTERYLHHPDDEPEDGWPGPGPDAWRDAPEPRDPGANWYGGPRSAPPIPRRPIHRPRRRLRDLLRALFL